MKRRLANARSAADKPSHARRSWGESRAVATQVSLTLTGWLFENDRLPEAKERCIELLRTAPEELEAWRLYGRIAAALRDDQAVVDALVPVLDREPKDSSSALVLAASLAHLGDWEQALTWLQTIPPESADWGGAQLALAEIYAQRARWGEAETTFRLLLAQDPSQAASWMGLIKALSRQGRSTEAAQYLDDWVRHAPNEIAPWRARGIFHSGWGLLASAEHDLKRALHLDGGHADTYLALANVFHLEKKLSAAFEAVERALEIDPSSSSARERKAVLLLETGQFEEGWRLYQSRPLPPRDFREKPLWLGEFPIAGKTILVHCEQGLGDQIQFVRYLAPLAELGAKIILLIDRSLKQLCSTLAGASLVKIEGDPLPVFDMHCPLLSLPLALRTSVHGIPDRTPYLRAEEALVRRWAERLGPQKALRVGLVWSGGVRPHRAEYSRMLERRNIAFAKLAAFAGLDVEFVGLQKGLYAAAEEIELAGGALFPLKIVNLGEEFDDFADTAAVIANLDLVVSVDTAVAHLAGALHAPVWILNRFDSCWRWLNDRTDSPWYPSAKLYRQAQFDDWQPVLEQVRLDLDERARQWRAEHFALVVGESAGPQRPQNQSLTCCALGQTVDSTLDASAWESEIQRVLSELGSANAVDFADFLDNSIDEFAQSASEALLVVGTRSLVSRDCVAGFLEFLANCDDLDWDLIFPEVELKSPETVSALANVANNLNQANELTVLNLAEFEFELGKTLLIRRTALAKLAPYFASAGTPGEGGFSTLALRAAIADGRVAAFSLFPFLPTPLAADASQIEASTGPQAALYRHSLSGQGPTEANRVHGLAGADEGAGSGTPWVTVDASGSQVA